jgi:hypothetical protein
MRLPEECWPELILYMGADMTIEPFFFKGHCQGWRIVARGSYWSGTDWTIHEDKAFRYDNINAATHDAERLEPVHAKERIAALTILFRIVFKSTGKVDVEALIRFLHKHVDFDTNFLASSPGCTVAACYLEWEHSTVTNETEP